MHRDDFGGGGGTSEKFEVDPAAVAEVGQNVRRLAESAGRAQTYATGNLLLTNGEGSLILALCEWMYDLEGTVGDYFGDLRTITHDSGVELRASAATYRKTDDRTSARIDRAYWSQ